MTLVSILLATALAAEPMTGHDAEAAQLSGLNERVIRSYVLERDPSGYRTFAHPRYKFIFAPGIIENLNIVIAGADQVDLERFEVRTLSTDIVGDTALILTVVEAEGTVAGRPFPDRVAMMHVWVREDGEWKLLGETMTPILAPPEVFEQMRKLAIEGN